MIRAWKKPKQLQRAAQPSAESRLYHAISSFERDLSPEQQADLKAAKTNPHEITPTSSDVFRLTAEIDRIRSAKGKSGIGPRLTSFLQALQQFAALGDIIVGGSQNIIACSVWSVVRLTLTVSMPFTLC
jgi:ankyrin repeat domain-containing protein 50